MHLVGTLLKTSGRSRRLPAFRPRCSASAEAHDFDWSRVLEADPNELPEPIIDQKTLEDQSAWWKRVEEEDFLDQPITETPEVTSSEPVPHELLASVPLPLHSVPPSLHPKQAKIRAERYEEDFLAHAQTSNARSLIDGFIEMRKEGFIPGPHWYHALIPKVQMYQDDKAIDMLIKEMKALNYPLSATVHTALVIQALLKRDTTDLEIKWKDMLEDKFEPSLQLYAHKLLYLCRFTTDLDAVINLYNEIIGKGHKDPLIANIVLAMCRENSLFELADKIYNEMQANGMMEVDEKRDTVNFEFGKHSLPFVAKAQSIENTYVIMLQIACRKVNEAEADMFMEEINKIHSRYLKTGNNDTWEKTKDIYEDLLSLYTATKNYPKAKALMDEMIATDKFPGMSLMRSYFKFVLSLNQPKLYQQCLMELELLGFTFDEELCREAMKMWFNVKDYRRFKNTWESCIQLGYKPGAECSTLMMKIYAESSYPGEVQQFYDLMIRSNAEMTREMHIIMMNEYLKQGFPGSARVVAKKLASEKEPISQEELEAIAAKYAALGGAKQVQDIITRDVEQPGSPYTVTAKLFSYLLQGYSQTPSQLVSIHKVWNKYSAMVVFDIDTAERCIQALNKLREPVLALNVYERVKGDHQFKPSDSTSIFASILQSPPVEGTPLQKRLAVFEDLYSYGIVADLRVYLAAISLCGEYASVSGALSIMKRFVVENYGIPFHCGLCLDFLSIIARFDAGEYKSLARAWLNRLMPRQNNLTPFLPSLREELGKPSDLNEKREELLSITQSLSFGKFVANLQYDQLVSPQEESYSSLFQGSDVDIEDILIHKYGKDPAAVYEALHDPEYEQVKEATEKLARKRALLLSEEESKE